jgi:hypothetical protein
MHQATKLSVLTLAIFFPLNLLAQQFDWKTGYLGFMDNREVDNTAFYGQTMFGSRLNGEIGVSPDSTNRFAAGLDFLYEYGWQGPYKRPSLVLYYEGSFKNLNYSFGSFNRYKKIDMPIALLNDTLNYYRPDIEGMFIEYKMPSFRQNIWIDWTGRKTSSTRESFIMGFSGYFEKGLFIYQHHLVMNHISLTEPMQAGTYVRDNFGATVKAGLNLSSLTALDSLVFIAGWIGSLDRQRHLYNFMYSKGFTCELEARYRHFGLHEMVCISNGLTILPGDAPYSAKYYNRADLYYQVINSYIDARIQFSYHHIPMTDMVSTIAVVRINTDGLFRKHDRVRG